MVFLGTADEKNVAIPRVLIPIPMLDYQPWPAGACVRSEFVQDWAKGIISHDDNLQRRVFPNKPVRRPDVELS